MYFLTWLKKIEIGHMAVPQNKGLFHLVTKLVTYNNHISNHSHPLKSMEMPLICSNHCVPSSICFLGHWGGEYNNNNNNNINNINQVSQRIKEYMCIYTIYSAKTLSRCNWKYLKFPNRSPILLVLKASFPLDGLPGRRNLLAEPTEPWSGSHRYCRSRGTGVHTASYPVTISQWSLWAQTIKCKWICLIFF